jgi:acetylornithine deacetylase/succinyl-diaminopimelate desuccinylase-like protein
VKKSAKIRQANAASAASPLVKDILAISRAPQFERDLRDLLVDLCATNTTPNPNVAVMRRAEGQCFTILERELRKLRLAGARTERRAINPAIKRHPHYSLLHFTKTPRRPEGLSPEKTYAGRANLLYVITGANGARDGKSQSVAVNAHVDVVAPYFPPTVKGRTVFGRGAGDDKGPVVSIVGALRILAQLAAKRGLRLNRNVVAMFVVEEETGGNGSLSLATDAEVKRLYDSLLVCECTDLKIYPANRGAVWYRADLQKLRGVSAFEMFAFLNEYQEKEGAAIRAESRHALFPQRPVQTCHGILGPFGEHPSRICGEVRFTVQFDRKPAAKTEQLVRDCFDAGLAGYIGLYGDKAKVTDPATGKAMVKRHYDFKRKDHGFVVTVHGATGHMGAIRERDGAITKTAHLVRSLVGSKARLEASGGRVEFALAGDHAGDALVLEGGQGFIPTHDIDEVMDRMRQAAQRGAENYLRRIGRRERGEDVVSVTYEKLHNVAFDGDPNSPSMRNAIAAAKACGIWKNEPVLGWTVSCDARLFATEYPNMPVLTFGPGQLAHAHSDQEQIGVDELRTAAEFLALFLLQQTGTAKVG